MASPRDDDRLPELPPLDGTLGDDEELGSESGFGEVLDDRGAPEDVGLDDRTGEGEPLDVAELLGLSDTDGETEQWSEGSEDAGDQVGELAIASEGDEYGWTEGTEAAVDQEWEADLDGAGPESGFLEDSGEEGVEDDFSLPGLSDAEGHDDDVSLPPLHRDEIDEEDVAEDLDLGGEADIADLGLTFEEEQRLSGVQIPAPLSQDRVSVAHLGPDDEDLDGLARRGAQLVAAGDERLYALRDNELAPLHADGLSGLELTSVALLPGHVVVGTRLGGALRSEDDGGRFSPINGWRSEHAPVQGFFVYSEPHERGARLWGRTAGGCLFVSEDAGDRWVEVRLEGRVTAFSVDPGGGVGALCVPSDADAMLVRSLDGGSTWDAWTVPYVNQVAEDAEQHLLVRGALVAVGCGQGLPGPLVSTDGATSFEQVSWLPAAGPIAAAVEAGATDPQPDPAEAVANDASGVTVLYAGLFFASSDRGVVIRYHPTEGTALVLDVPAERAARQIEERGDPEGDNRVSAIVVEPLSDRTRMWVATGAGLFRVDVRHGSVQ